MKKKLILILVIALVVGLGIVGFLNRGAVFSTKLTQSTNSSVLNYEVAPDFDYKISLFAKDAGEVTRMRITPDGKTMLVATLSGEINAYNKVNDEFIKQEKPFFTLKTNLPGFPPEESGLSGLVLGADFEKSKDIFLLHATRIEDKSLRNRVTRVTFTHRGDEAYGEDPAQIFEANTEAGVSHQIEGGVGVMVAGKPHLMFNLGDGTKANTAHDLAKESGKVMLIQRDGADPIGGRPYPKSPKVQAIGLRNAFDIALNPLDPQKRFVIGDTGTDNYDRLIYGKLLDIEGRDLKPLDLNWNGSDQSLTLPIPDINISGQPDMVLHRWAPTETITDIVFSQMAGKPIVLLNIWGKTGSLKNKPGKKMLLGAISGLSGQPKIELKDFVQRSSAGEGKLGHPIGLAADSVTGAIYFGDMMERVIYKVEPNKK